MPESASKRFVEQVGAWRVSGRRRIPDRAAAPDVPPAEAPLVVALHGGTYTSAYFDLPGFSLLDRAAAAGIPIVALDRPCYGETTPLDPGTETIRNSAERLDAIIAGLVAQSAEPERKIVLLGHSIGAAIALAIAARQPSWRLIGVAVSGMCLESPPEAGAAWSALPETTMVELPPALKDAVMFGPDHTFDPPMPGLGHHADAPVPRAELIDIVMGWPDIAGDVLGDVRVPVYYRLGEFDRLWVTDAEQVARFAAALSTAPRVDAALMRGVGHCIDFHRLGAEFQAGQIDFALGCGAATSDSA
ncbi:alpha/beta hydrolase [uncultured Sphingomonas sp.]|uniref:alpha/beta hydrolase n=1 Tax=uncultured Sphingomonas sp. TaxID=158754 RepID=UPI0035CB4871